MFAPFFEPITIKDLQLANRIVMAPMTRSKSKHNIPDADVIAYYRRRAEGGVGLIITEGTAVGHKASHGYPDVPNFYGKEALAGWREVVQAVHQAGGKIFPQLWHVGSMRQSGMTPDPAILGYAPSAVVHPGAKDKEAPQAMTLADIDAVIAAFTLAASNAKQLGFDGIEIHGAHGYLIDQFFWSYSNKRTDLYGGKYLQERTRFAVDLIQSIRREVGIDFPIGLRFSQWKLGAYEAKLAETPQELEQFLLPLVDAGVDIFHASTRRLHEPEFRGSTLNLAGWTKKLTGKTTITVGSVGLDVDFVKTFREQEMPQATQENLKYVLDGLERGDFDMVAVGRAILADPNWPQKIANNKFAEITPFTQESLQRLY